MNLNNQIELEIKAYQSKQTNREKETHEPL